MPTIKLRAEKLRVAAEAQGDRTSYAIAKRTGLSQTTIGRLRKGTAAPTTASLLILASTYGLPVEDLVEHGEPAEESA